LLADNGCVWGTAIIIMIIYPPCLSIRCPHLIARVIIISAYPGTILNVTEVCRHLS
jgi:hypothetical protein